MQKTAETEFMKNIGSVEITSVPPMKGLSFTQPVFLKNWMQIFLFLHKRTKTILVNGFVISAKSSKHSCCSFVLAKKRNVGMEQAILTLLKYIILHLALWFLVIMVTKRLDG